MSISVDLAEFLPAYVVEVDEHLRAAHRALTAIDAAQRQGQSNARAARDLFRALHTIKGLSAMLGVEPIVTIVHRMEGAVRAAERAGGAIPAAGVDVLLQALSAVEQRVRARAEGKEVAAPLAALLEALDGLDVPARAAAATHLALDPFLAEKLAPAERDQLAAGVAAGRRAVSVAFSPSPALAERGLTINSVRERLGRIADLVRVFPRGVPPSADAPGGLTFEIVCLTKAADDEVAATLGLAAAVRALSIAAPAPAPEPPAIEDAAEPPRHGFLRVDLGRLEDALERLSAIVVDRFRLERAAGALAASGAATRELEALLGEHARHVRDLRAALLRLRMVPIEEVLDRIPLLVRGLGRTTGKPVHLEIDGGGAELDKVVAERIFPAIVHLVRNAIDHGLEPPEERRLRGKPEEGLLRITCSARSSVQLELTISDDGRGVDREAVARRAGREAPRTDAALLDLLCAPGLSTREQTTTTSGRGMGLDIVRRAVVEELGGELQLGTTPGGGTTFTLRVPLTIAIVDVLAFECAGQRFAAPMAMVEEIVEIDPARIHRGPSRRGGAIGLFQRRGEAVPLVALADVIHLGAAAPASKAIVVRRGGEPVAFGVDRMLGKREAVVRPLEDPLVRVRGVAGATEMGDGRPTLVLDLVALSGAVGKEDRAT